MASSRSDGENDYSLLKAEFHIDGPYEIPFEQKKGGRVLLHKNLWTQSDHLSDLGKERGCYVFAVRAGKGATPIYVGKATKSFKQECFNPSNRHKFSNGWRTTKEELRFCTSYDIRPKKEKPTPNRSVKSKIF